MRVPSFDELERFLLRLILLLMLLIGGMKILKEEASELFQPAHASPATAVPAQAVPSGSRAP